MSESPIDRMLEAIDKLDLDGAAALIAPDGQLLVADGRHARGVDAVHQLLDDFMSKLRSTSHRVIAHWQVDNVWIAELEAEYELRDRLKIGPLPRAVFLRDGPNGIDDIRFYGAHEHPVNEHRTGQEGLWIGGRWVPPL